MIIVICAILSHLPSGNREITVGLDDREVPLAVREVPLAVREVPLAVRGGASGRARRCLWPHARG